MVGSQVFRDFLAHLLVAATRHCLVDRPRKWEYLVGTDKSNLNCLGVSRVALTPGYPPTGCIQVYDVAVARQGGGVTPVAIPGFRML